ncbi:hypothetical protein PAXINDRAFT_17327 [Paxillus involutus ATCC 200175]|uniref:SAP domain-containing protein n=1 Tax=Paxillus involutus ATCC 200175 TaxID=664439 RepID=A0A0C9TF85_PAXIN|nr:hypothetical protein PAXINDRAFT_17327 [Paxillus involutus ATCC 200175]
MDTEALSLPEPGQIYVEGNELKRLTFTVTMKTTKAQIQEQLRTYSLTPLKGNKSSLLETLRQFSKDEDAWLSIFQPLKKRKRGIHNNRSSLSTQRIADQFGEPEKQLNAYKSKKSVDRVQRGDIHRTVFVYGHDTLVPTYTLVHQSRASL